MRCLDLEDPNVTARKAERLAQSRIRLEQQQRHIAVQEEKNRLREEKIRQEKIEKRIKLLKRLFIEYPLKVGVAAVKIAAKIVTVAGSLFLLLREAAQFNPSAAYLYNEVITTITGLVERVKNRTLRENVGAIFDKMLSLVKSAFKRRTDSVNKALLNKAIRDEYSSLVFYAMNMKVPKSFTDSVKSHRIPKRYRDMANKIVSRRIRLHDKKYNDMVGTTVVAGGLAATILPILLGILKAGIIGGIASALSAPIKEKVTMPMVNNLVDHIKNIIKSKDKDEKYTEALIKQFKFDFENFLDLLRQEKSYIYPQLAARWQKIKGMIA